MNTDLEKYYNKDYTNTSEDTFSGIIANIASISDREISTMIESFRKENNDTRSDDEIRPYFINAIIACRAKYGKVIDKNEEINRNANTDMVETIACGIESVEQWSKTLKEFTETHDMTWDKKKAELTPMEITLKSIEEEKQIIIEAQKKGSVSYQYMHGYVQACQQIDNIIHNQGLLIERKAFPNHLVFDTPGANTKKNAAS